MGELEAWDYLSAYQALRTQSADEVAKIKAACAQTHPQHQHVIQCRECYPQIINRIRSTYLDPIEGQWFTGREAFLRDLDALFAAALHYEAKLVDVDARIEAEKRDWYFEQVKASPSIPRALEELLDRKDLVGKVGNKDVGFENHVKDMRTALNGGSDPQTAQEALDRLIAVKTPAERLQVYKQTFFQGRSDESISEKAQLYLEKLQAGVTIKEIANKVTSDAAAATIAAPEQKERYQKRIEELQRAKAAYELQKSKKATQRPQPPEKTYEVPPCNVCRRDVDKEEFIGCPYCTILLDASIRPKTTVWCSQACSDHDDHGFGAHADESHGCAGRDYCVQLIDDDVDMDADNADDYMCRECTDRLRIETVFCSIRCAEHNFKRHREGVHIQERMKRELEVDRDVDDLVFVETDKSRYHARDIRSHVASVGELMRDLKQRNGLNP
ncbi:hypothetical protein VM1G_00495 [Cytospora mali]|uniref:Uncharacterized protein n=1 Tax=Cytospora mali TaxID=578113 RepID=A0A194VKQ2_CYTMA|nr:hypothetical protein VM1G_00495 [Valsa mali]